MVQCVVGYNGVVVRTPPHVCVCCRRNETRPQIANPPNSAQLEGTPNQSPSYTRVHAGMSECSEGQTDIHTAVANIHFVDYASCEM